MKENVRNMIVPVCFAYGRKTNDGVATGAGLEEVLIKSAACGSSIKKNGIGYKYWMLDVPEINIDDDKSDWLSKWNGHYNIDIDLKDLLRETGCISVKQRKQTYFSKKRGMTVTNVTTHISIDDAAKYRNIMTTCRSIFDRCLATSFKYAFITGSECGFNYVCDGRPYEDTDWKTNEYYEKSFYFIYGGLMSAIAQFAEKSPDDNEREIAGLLMQYASKTFDATAVQITRVKFLSLIHI